MNPALDNPPFETLRVVHQDDGICHIIMSRPDVFNAFNEAMIGELDRAMRAAIDHETVRIIVLAGEGRHFSAGADLKWMQRASCESAEWNLKDAGHLADLLFRIHSCPKPTVARIQGAALGGGVGLACACDIALAADNASFTLSEAKFGILPAVIGPYLHNAVGMRQAVYLALTTRRIRAEQALSIGLVHEVAPLRELDHAIESLAQDLLRAGPNAQREIKALFGQFRQGEISQLARDHTAQTISRVRVSDEAREGLRAFFEKRNANWVG